MAVPGDMAGVNSSSFHRYGLGSFASLDVAYTMGALSSGGGLRRNFVPGIVLGGLGGLGPGRVVGTVVYCLDGVDQCSADTRRSCGDRVELRKGGILRRYVMEGGPCYLETTLGLNFMGCGMLGGLVTLSRSARVHTTLLRCRGGRSSLSGRRRGRQSETRERLLEARPAITRVGGV